MNMQEITEKQLELPGMNTGFYEYFKDNEINFPALSDPQITKIEDLDFFYNKEPKLT
jgi:hypothetical protein